MRYFLIKSLNGCVSNVHLIVYVPFFSQFVEPCVPPPSAAPSARSAVTRIKNSSPKFPLLPHKAHNKCRVAQRMYPSPFTKGGAGKKTLQNVNPSIQKGFVWRITFVSSHAASLVGLKGFANKRIYLRLYGILSYCRNVLYADRSP